MVLYDFCLCVHGKKLCPPPGFCQCFSDRYFLSKSYGFCSSDTVLLLNIKTLGLTRTIGLTGRRVRQDIEYTIVYFLYTIFTILCTLATFVCNLYTPMSWCRSHNMKHQRPPIGNQIPLNSPKFLSCYTHFENHDYLHLTYTFSKF